MLKDQEGSVYFVHPEVGGMREPHWHPTVWELNYVISGRARWTVMGTHPDGTYRNDVPESALAAIPTDIKPVVITRHK